MVNLEKTPEHFHIVSARSGKRMMNTIGIMGKIHTAIGSQSYSHLLRNDLDSLRRVMIFDYTD